MERDNAAFGLCSYRGPSGPERNFVRFRQEFEIGHSDAGPLSPMAKFFLGKILIRLFLSVVGRRQRPSLVARSLVADSQGTVNNGRVEPASVVCGYILHFPASTFRMSHQVSVGLQCTLWACECISRDVQPPIFAYTTSAIVSDELNRFSPSEAVIVVRAGRIKSIRWDVSSVDLSDRPVGVGCPVKRGGRSRTDAAAAAASSSGCNRICRVENGGEAKRKWPGHSAESP
jgi:hypothetical protein